MNERKCLAGRDWERGGGKHGVTMYMRIRCMVSKYEIRELNVGAQRLARDTCRVLESFDTC